MGQSTVQIQGVVDGAASQPLPTHSIHPCWLVGYILRWRDLGGLLFLASFEEVNCPLERDPLRGHVEELRVASRK